MINPKNIHEQARLNILGILYLNIYLTICAFKDIYVYLNVYVTVRIKEKIHEFENDQCGHRSHRRDKTDK